MFVCRAVKGVKEGKGPVEMMGAEPATSSLWCLVDCGHAHLDLWLLTVPTSHSPLLPQQKE